jgi:GABA(A) receptor-associated protein
MSLSLHFPSPSPLPFKTRCTFDQRYEEAHKIREKYPDRIPVICEIDPRNSSSIYLKKMKYLVPGSLTLGQFMFVLRKQITLNQEEAVFVMINNTLPQAASLLSQIYKDHKDPDGFLYFFLCKESVFGA